MNRIVLTLSVLMMLPACTPHDEAKQPAAPSPNAVKEVHKASSDSAANDMAIAKDYTEKLFQNPFDPDAVYFLSQRSGTPKAIGVMIKRDSQDGTQYSRWLFNCVDQTAQNLGVAMSIQDLNKSTNSMPTASQRYELKTKLGAIATAVCP